MLAEVLLVLGGYPSSLITADGVAPTLAEHLHPGEAAALATLGRLAGHYRTVRDWALATQGAARAAVLKKPREGEEEGSQPGQYTAVLAGAVRGVLDDYTALLVDTEARILASDNAVVQPSDSGAYVPLSLLLASLASLVHSLPPTPGELLTHLSALSSSGDPTLKRIYTSLLAAVWRLFLSHLCVFLLDGLAPETSSPAAPALGLDAGADPPHRLYRLNTDILPGSVGASARESILYVGRVAATLKREGRALPRAVTEPARQRVMASEPGGLDKALQRVRADVGEWLWTHILTGRQVADAIEGL
jgi:AcrR family transcriptional regulator